MAQSAVIMLYNTVATPRYPPRVTGSLRDSSNIEISRVARVFIVRWSTPSVTVQNSVLYMCCWTHSVTSKLRYEDWIQCECSTAHTKAWTGYVGV
jgi:hypothetical protein